MTRCIFALTVSAVVSILAPKCRAVVYNFVNIADLTTQAPFETFEGFNNPSISGDKVVFVGRYRDPADPELSHRGIFMGSGGPLTTLAKTGDATDIRPFIGDSFTNSEPAIHGNEVVFKSRIPEATFKVIDDQLTVVARIGSAAPHGQFYAGELGSPAISDGNVAFRAVLTNDIDSVVIDRNGQTDTIVKTGDPAPNGVFGFEDFADDPTISGNRVAFRASYPGGQGIFVGDGDTLTTIAKLGDPAPVGSITFLAFPWISGDNIVFEAEYGGTGGILLSSGGALTPIVELGDPVPSGGVFTDLTLHSISGSTVLFGGRYAGGRGIFTTDGSTITPVLQTGSPLFGSTIASSPLGRFGFDPDGTGNVAFIYALADGRNGVAAAIAVPEPSTFATAWLALAVISCGNRSRRIVIKCS